MPREGYIKELRRHVGSMPLFLPSVAVFVRDGTKVVVGHHRDVERWVIPGGALEPGELVAACAVREVREETGLDVRLTGIHGVYGGGPAHRVTYPNGDVVDYVVTVFDAIAVGGQLLAQTDELTQIGWLEVDALQELAVPAWMPPMLDHPGWEPAS